MAGYPFGVDVSNNNGSVDFDAMAASGVQFAICKASEGTWFRDSWFDDYWAECKRLSIARGAYHFARPSQCAPQDEAAYFLDAIESLWGSLETGDILALDLEDEHAYGDLSGWALTWLQEVERRVGFKPLVYVSPSYASSRYLARKPEIGQYGLWLASWGVPTPPPAPPPWSLVAIHQYDVGDPGTVPGVSGAIDCNRFNGSSVAQLQRYGKPAGAAVPPEPGPEPVPPPAEGSQPDEVGPGGPDLPVYDWTEPARLQEHDWDCSVESCEWMLYAWGRTPDDDWLENTMIAEGVVSPEIGCLDATGAGLAGFLNRHYGGPHDGFWAENDPEVGFDDIAVEASTAAHPLACGGRGWYHWSGVRGYDAAADVLLLANPAPGWQGVDQTLSREHWQYLGPWSLVRLTHPAAEAWVPPNPGPDPPEPEPTPPSVWTETVGSGLLQMMAEDLTEPAQSASMWVGGPPAEIEQCYGKNGILYVWLLSEARGFRIKPS
jgi:GH25 family lysozyme M1 (1,4-beta-N-acetylmuramidase)